jgi:hypothetical protein
MTGGISLQTWECFCITGLLCQTQCHHSRVQVRMLWVEIGQTCDSLLIIYHFFLVLEFELRAYILSHFASPFFVKGFLWDRLSWTICPSWLQTLIFLISASWVARITGVSHQLLADFFTFKTVFCSGNLLILGQFWRVDHSVYQQS